MADAFYVKVCSATDSSDCNEETTTSRQVTFWGRDVNNQTATVRSCVTDDRVPSSNAAAPISFDGMDLYCGPELQPPARSIPHDSSSDLNAAGLQSLYAALRMDEKTLNRSFHQMFRNSSSFLTFCQATPHDTCVSANATALGALVAMGEPAFVDILFDMLENPQYYQNDLLAGFDPTSGGTSSQASMPLELAVTTRMQPDPPEISLASTRYDQSKCSQIYPTMTCDNWIYFYGNKCYCADPSPASWKPPSCPAPTSDCPTWWSSVKKNQDGSLYFSCQSCATTGNQQFCSKTYSPLACSRWVKVFPMDFSDMFYWATANANKNHGLCACVDQTSTASCYQKDSSCQNFAIPTIRSSTGQWTFGDCRCEDTYIDAMYARLAEQSKDASSRQASTKNAPSGSSSPFGNDAKGIAEIVGVSVGGAVALADLIIGGKKALAKLATRKIRAGLAVVQREQLDPQAVESKFQAALAKAEAASSPLRPAELAENLELLIHRGKLIASPDFPKERAAAEKQKLTLAQERLLQGTSLRPFDKNGEFQAMGKLSTEQLKGGSDLHEALRESITSESAVYSGRNVKNRDKAKPEEALRTVPEPRASSAARSSVKPVEERLGLTSAQNVRLATINSVFALIKSNYQQFVNDRLAITNFLLSQGEGQGSAN